MRGSGGEGHSYTARGEPSDVYESTPHSSGYYHVTESYWANGAVNQLSNLVGLPTITYNVDGEGRVYSVSASSGQNPLTSTTYNTASLPTAVNLGSSDSDTYQFDSNTNRMTQYKFNVNGQSVVGALTWNSIGTLASLGVTDPFFTGGNQSCTYSHDDLTRIASANCGSVFSQTFSYDAFSNLSKSGTISFLPIYSTATNRITTLGSFNVVYDANGSITNDSIHTYSYDAAGRPVTIDSVNLTYDALGRMVEQNRSGTYTEIVYGPHGGKLALMSGQTLQKAFVPLSGGAVAVYTSTGLAYYRHSDWLGSSRLASTPTRTMYSDEAYAPFGEPYAQSGAADLSFTGMNQDTVSGLYDFPAREYGTQGRWPSPDPAGIASVSLTDPQSWNRYAYMRNTPSSSIDPSGMGPRREDPSRNGCELFPMTGTCDIWGWMDPQFGNDIFDAIAGVPGTFLYTDQFGNVGFGWSCSLYSLTQNIIDSVNRGISLAPWGGIATNPAGPDILHDLPEWGYQTYITNVGGEIESSGLIPDYISAFTYSIWLGNAMGGQPGSAWVKNVGYFDVLVQKMEKWINEIVGLVSPLQQSGDTVQ